LYIVNSDEAYTYELLEQDIKAVCKEYPFLEHFSLGQSVCGR